ncbi:MAG: PqiC family protein [Steroidobacteraceae bacterium]
MRRIASNAAAFVIAAFVCGCASPASHLYTLTPAPGTSAAQAPCNVSVVVGPVSVPAVDDVPQIVLSTGPNQVAHDEFNRWASPLQSNIARVVAEDLVTMLGTPRVMLFQQAVDTKHDYQVAIEVQSFESALGEAATLNAVWTVRRVSDGKTQTGRTSAQEAIRQKGYDALVAAHSRAIDRMSQDIADTIRALDRAPPSSPAG